MSRTSAFYFQIALALLLLAFETSAARAEHAIIKLQVIGPEGRQEAGSADHEPPVGGVYPRRRLTVKPGAPLVLQFFWTNTYPHKQIDDVTVRYFVVRTARLGVKQTPELKEGVILQGTVGMNFKPQCSVGARLKFQIDEPGAYLVRVETLNTQSDHEHFSALDLEVK